MHPFELTSRRGGGFVWLIGFNLRVGFELEVGTRSMQVTRMKAHDVYHEAYLCKETGRGWTVGMWNVSGACNP